MKCILVIAFVMIYISYGSTEHPDPKGYFDLTRCCEVEKTAAQTEYIEKMIKLAEECKQELGPPESDKPHKFICMHECIASKTKTINADKSLSENDYRNFVKDQMAAQPFQKAVADAIINKCIEELKKSETGNSDEPNSSGCNKQAMLAFRCAAKEIFNSCPADLQDTTEKCTKLREMMNNSKVKKLGEAPFDGREDK